MNYLKVKNVMNTERPKGEIDEWYTLTTDFDGYWVTANQKAGYTWQCSEVDVDDKPMIDGMVIANDEGYRLATPEEIARAKGEQVTEHPKPSKEAREFWERAFIATVQSPKEFNKSYFELADSALAEWQKRFDNIDKVAF